MFTDEELDLWLFWVDHDLMPRNAKMEELLARNAHLIFGNELPKSYIAFLNHYNNWRMEHDRWKEANIPYSWHSKINWSKEFEDEVLRTFKGLMEDHAELIGAIGGRVENHTIVRNDPGHSMKEQGS